MAISLVMDKSVSKYLRELTENLSTVNHFRCPACAADDIYGKLKHRCQVLTQDEKVELYFEEAYAAMKKDTHFGKSALLTLAKESHKD